MSFRTFGFRALCIAPVSIVPAEASTLSSDDVRGIWDHGTPSLVVGDGFDAIRLAASDAFQSAQIVTSHETTALQALMTTALVTAFVVSLVPRLPPYWKVRQYWAQLSLADRATWRIR